MPLDDAPRWYDMVDRRLHVLENRKPKVQAGTSAFPWFAINFGWSEGEEVVADVQPGSSALSDGGYGAIPSIHGMWLTELRLVLGANDYPGVDPPSGYASGSGGRFYPQSNYVRIVHATMISLPFFANDWPSEPLEWVNGGAGGGTTDWACWRLLTAFCPGGPTMSITAGWDGMGETTVDGRLSGVLLLPDEPEFIGSS